MIKRIFGVILVLPALCAPALAQPVRNLQDAYLCRSYGTQAGQLDSQIDFLISRRDEELANAEYWASQGDEQLFHAFYDKVENYQNQISDQITEYGSAIDQLNAFCADVYFENGAVATACAGEVGNPWCDNANR